MTSRIYEHNADVCNFPGMSGNYAHAHAIFTRRYFSLDQRLGTRLLNPYAERKATRQEQEDLMSLREISEKEFEKYVEYNILHKPSTNAPNRKRKLLTFSHRKANKTLINQLEKDKQLIMKCLQKRLK